MRKCIFLTTILLVIISLLIMLDRDFTDLDEKGLAREVANLKIEVAELRLAIQGNKSLKYPLDITSKSAVEKASDEFLPSKAFDLIWKKLFHYITFFESLDGFVTTAGVAIADDQLTLTTTGSGTDFQRVVKQPNNQGLITFSQKSAMRSNFQVSQLTNQTIYIAVGNVAGGAQGYGFKVINDTLYGVTHNGTTETTVKIAVIAASTKYGIEARYFPNDGVKFFSDDPTTSPATLMREVVALAVTLPSASAVSNTNLFQIRITENAAAAKIMRVSFFEYLQTRNILR